MTRLRCSSLLLAVAVLPVLAGCGSGRATAEGDREERFPAAETNDAEPSRSAVEDEERPSPPDRIVDKTFDDVKFEMESDEPFRREMLTGEIEALAGRRIRIRGYILPTTQKRGIKQFVLVRDNQECCFGPGAALYDCILVEMEPGRTIEYSIRPVAVEGTFHIDILPGLDGAPLAIYRMAGEAVD